MLSRLRTLALAGALGAFVVAAPAGARLDDPLPRFEDKICPGVAGLQVEAAETMVGMVRANLEALGLETAPVGDCMPNVIIAFVGDGEAFMRAWAESNDQFLVELDLDEREAVLTQPGPGRAVHEVRTRSRDGLPVPRPQDLSNVPQTSGWMAHSKIYTAVQNDIHSSLVLIDADAVPGRSVRQLADYATYRALTDTLPPAAARGESIVSLFDGGEAPRGLTELDRKVLATLYSGVPNLPGSSRLAALSRATGHDFSTE